ncbi:putative c6 transcription factor [Diplodia seriata]|uniref:Putative c6 transcription factor n=1 Tax=Diplodia seriata TaxID=420778 RepID=A0A0G2G538_9PEZI|nr:putative c6 transcription factor [Diplodia seriata]
MDTIIPTTIPTMTSQLQDDERYDNYNNRLLPDNMASTSDNMPGLDEPDLELNMADLELLHHFTVTTAYTLGATAELQTWWRIEVPHLAISHPFVMRALLSLSGIHLAHTLLSPSSSSSPSDDNDNNNNISLEQRRLQAAHHTARALYTDNSASDDDSDNGDNSGSDNSDPAVAAGIAELAALRRWFVALYEQR